MFVLRFPFTNRVYIRGYFKDLSKIQAISTSHHNRVIATTTTNVNSYYEFDFLDEFSRTESLKFYYVNNKDTLLLKTISQLKSDDFKLDLYMPSISKKQSKHK
jgi:hypothetical protein